jgi:hypothetical protein
LSAVAAVDDTIAADASAPVTFASSIVNSTALGHPDSVTTVLQAPFAMRKVQLFALEGLMAAIGSLLRVVTVVVVALVVVVVLLLVRIPFPPRAPGMPLLLLVLLLVIVAASV